jgi:DNA helicase HerA-like ATPase
MAKKKSRQPQITVIDKSAELKLLQGTATLADLMAPPAIKYMPEYFEVGKLFCCSMAVTFYPRELFPGWMQGLTSIDIRSDISMHIHPVEKRLVDMYLKRKMAGIMSTQFQEQEKGKIESVSDQSNMEDIELLRYKLFAEGENFFQVTLLVNVYGENKEDLENNISYLTNAIKEIGIDLKILKLQQSRGIESVLPYGNDTVKNYHNFYTSALATAFPFTQANIQVENGILYGESLVSGTPFFYDIFNKDYNDNYNKVIIGWSGSGKSFTTKLLANRYAIRGTKIMVIDPTTQEYVAFARHLGGQIIDISPKSESIINPFDLAQVQSAAASDLRQSAQSIIETKIQYLIGLFQIMLDGNLTPLENAILDKVLLLTYMRKGIFADKPETFTLEPPTMMDFDHVLSLITGIKELMKKYSNDKNSLSFVEKAVLAYKAFRSNPDLISAANGLKIKIEPYITGSLAQMFKGQTNVKLTNRVVVFNVGNTPDSQISLSMYIVFGEILNKVLSGGGREENIVVLDEAWKILRHSGAAGSVQTLIKEGRKMLCSTWLISQELADYKDSKEGLSALRNASVKILLKSTPAAMEEQKAFFRLSEGNAAFLTKASPGQGIMLMEKNQSVIAFYVRPTEHEKKIASTTYSEIQELTKIIPPTINADFSLIQNDALDPREVEHLHRRAQQTYGAAIVPATDQTTEDNMDQALDGILGDIFRTD